MVHCLEPAFGHLERMERSLDAIRCHKTYAMYTGVPVLRVKRSSALTTCNEASK